MAELSIRSDTVHQRLLFTLERAIDKTTQTKRDHEVLELLTFFNCVLQLNQSQELQLEISSHFMRKLLVA